MKSRYLRYGHTTLSQILAAEAVALAFPPSVNFSFIQLFMKESIILTVTSFMALSAGAQWPDIQPPVAEKKISTRTLHGDTTVDNYYWMIDYFKQGADSTKVVEYLAAENNYLDQMMADTKQLQENLFTEMKARIKEKDESVPYFSNGYFYYSRTEDGKQYFKFCRKKGSLEAKEEILLDVDEMAKGHAYYAVTGFEVSENNKLLAYGVDEVSRRQYTIHIKNLETGEIYKDAIRKYQRPPRLGKRQQNLFLYGKQPGNLVVGKNQSPSPWRGYFL
jgi:oligopeptidase B